MRYPSIVGVGLGAQDKSTEFAFRLMLAEANL